MTHPMVVFTYHTILLHTFATVATCLKATHGEFVKVECGVAGSHLARSVRLCLVGINFLVLSLLVCTVCPSLSNPRYGTVDVSYDTATYSCKEGYRLHGNEQRNCTYGTWNGTWTGSKPSCVKSDFVVFLNLSVPVLIC